MKRHLFMALNVENGLNLNQIVRMGYYLIFKIKMLYLTFKENQRLTHIIILL